MPELKYEEAGGVGIEECFALLDERIKAGVMDSRDKVSLFAGLIFNFIVGNGDAHGQSFSLLYKGDGGGSERRGKHGDEDCSEYGDGDREKNKELLAPFYDILSTVVYVSPKANIAMSINGKERFCDITIEDFKALGSKLGFSEDFVESMVIMLSDLVLETSQELLVELNLDIRTASTIYEDIYFVIKDHHARLRG